MGKQKLMGLSNSRGVTVVVRSYSVAALVLTIGRSRQQLIHTVYRVIQLRSVSIATSSTEATDLYLTEIISDIGEFSHLIDCHGV